MMMAKDSSTGWLWIETRHVGVELRSEASIPASLIPPSRLDGGHQAIAVLVPETMFVGHVPCSSGS